MKQDTHRGAFGAGRPLQEHALEETGRASELPGRPPPIPKRGPGLPAPAPSMAPGPGGPEDHGPGLQGRTLRPGTGLERLPLLWGCGGGHGYGALSVSSPTAAGRLPPRTASGGQRGASPRPQRWPPIPGGSTQAGLGDGSPGGRGAQAEGPVTARRLPGGQEEEGPQAEAPRG